MFSADFSKCEAVDDISADCEYYSKRIHVIWQDPVGEFIISGCPDHLHIRFVISHNSRGYDTVFIAQVFGTVMNTSIDNGRY